MVENQHRLILMFRKSDQQARIVNAHRSSALID